MIAIIMEKGPYVSIATCGLPYFIGGEITDRNKLIVNSPQSLSHSLNINIQTQTEAIKIHRSSKRLEVIDVLNQTKREIPYDKLILSTGASPIRPSISGIDDPRIFTLRTLEDMDKIYQKTLLAKSVTVIGAGFIGLEMIEAFLNRGLKVTLIEKQAQVLPQLDADMTESLLSELESRGVQVLLGDSVSSFVSKVDSVTSRLASGKEISSDFVMIGIGVTPDSKLAQVAELVVGQKGIRVNEYMQTSDPDIYAVGDVVEAQDAVFPERRSWVPLAGPANRQGRLVANHITFGAEGGEKYRGNLGTAIVRFADTVAAITGWTEKRLQEANIPYSKSVITSTQHASYYPQALPITLKLLWSPENGRIYGAQAVGCEGVDKRIDVLATAINGRMNVADLSQLELCYAPPFGSAKDIINIAGFTAENIQRKLAKPIHSLSPNARSLDVREKAVSSINPAPATYNIPLSQLRERVSELDKTKPVEVFCRTSYFASRILAQRGFDASTLVGGVQHLKNSHKVKAATKIVPKQSEEVMLDCCGLACPGPIMAIRSKTEQLGPGQVMTVKASDMGFANDLPAFCKSTGLELLSMEKSKGVITGKIRKPFSSITQPQQSPVKNSNASIVVFSGELDKLLAALIIANGASAMGGRVTLFFTFWGLMALRKQHPEPHESHEFTSSVMHHLLPKGVDSLRLSHLNFCGIGSAMMKHTMQNKHLPNLPGLISDAKANGVRFVACTMSMEALGFHKEDLIDGLEFGGVADFLGAAQESSATLFI